MHLSPIGEAVLVAREGRRLKAYRDSKGIWTIGVGHTSAAGPPVVRPGLTLTAAECDALFARDVEAYVKAVRAALAGAPPLPQNAFDALVSLCYNIGPGAFRRSSILRRLRAGDRDGAADAILMWGRPREIVPRRQAEFDQFRTPYERALPRARRGDGQPIAPPVSAPVVAAARPSERRRPASPRTAQTRPGIAPPAPTATEPRRPGTLAGLWARLRARLHG